MYAGRIAERADVRDLINAPRHPYTRQLIESTPDISHPKSKVLHGIPGGLPAPDTPRERGLFADRCFQSEDVCFAERPPVKRIGRTEAACQFPLEQEAEHA